MRLIKSTQAPVSGCNWLNSSGPQGLFRLTEHKGDSPVARSAGFKYLITSQSPDLTFDFDIHLLHNMPLPLSVSVTWTLKALRWRLSLHLEPTPHIKPLSNLSRNERGRAWQAGFFWFVTSLRLRGYEEGWNNEDTPGTLSLRASPPCCVTWTTVSVTKRRWAPGTCWGGGPGTAAL